AKGFPEAFVKMAAARLPALVAVVPWNATTGDVPTVEVENFDLEDRRRIWGLEVSDLTLADQLARRFRVNLEDVRSAVRSARDAIRVKVGAGVEPALEQVTDQLLAQGARKMGRLVTRMKSRATLESLVVPKNIRQQLEDMLSWYRSSPRVF